MRRSNRSLGAVLLAAALGVASCRAGEAEPAEPAPEPSGAVVANATVTHVVDGDTVDVVLHTDPDGSDVGSDDGSDVESGVGDDDGSQDPDGFEERVRLIGIDTPETKRPDTPIECYGPEATAFVEALLPVGTPVRIERDIVARDDFGRLLGYLYLADDGTFVNELIVREGYATPLSIEPNTTFADVMVDAARAAESADLGLWQACSG